jgi:hypothetical protein
MILTLRIPWPLVSLNWRSNPYAMARSKRQRTRSTCEHAVVEMRRLGLAPNAPKRVTFTAHVARLMDEDNLIGAIKPYLDGLVAARLINTDAPPEAGNIHDIRIREAQQVIDRKWRGLEITITPRGEEAVRYSYPPVNRGR